METTIVLLKEELTFDFFENIKNIFKNSRLLQISISDSEDFNLYKKESQSEYFARLENAMNDVNKNKVSFSEQEFDAITNENI
jgi:hypothetical protein